AVDEAHLAETGRSRRVDEFGDDRWNVARDKRVQIELAANRDIDRELAVSHKAQIASGRADCDSRASRRSPRSVAEHAVSFFREFSCVLLRFSAMSAFPCSRLRSSRGCTRR